MPTADIQLMRDYMKFKRMDIFDRAHLGTAFTAKHKSVFKRKDQTDWYYPMNHLKDSSLIAWPVTVEKLSGAGRLIDYYAPSKHESEVTLICIFDLTEVMAREVTLKSWASQRIEYGK